MIDYEEKRSETRHRMGFMTPLLVFVLAFVACCGVIACVFLRAAVISDEAARESAGIALCRSAAEAFRAGEIHISQKILQAVRKRTLTII